MLVYAWKEEKHWGKGERGVEDMGEEDSGKKISVFA